MDRAYIPGFTIGPKNQTNSLIKYVGMEELSMTMLIFTILLIKATLSQQKFSYDFIANHFQNASQFKVKASALRKLNATLQDGVEVVEVEPNFHLQSESDDEVESGPQSSANAGPAGIIASPIRPDMVAYKQWNPPADSYRNEVNGQQFNHDQFNGQTVLPDMQSSFPLQAFHDDVNGDFARDHTVSDDVFSAFLDKYPPP